MVLRYGGLENKEMKQCKFIILIALLFSWQHLFAAEIFLGADKTQVNVNDTVSVTTYINTAGAPVNSAEGTIAFPNDMLSVESVSMSGSVFSIWVEQPSFSNNAGVISFNGGAPNPGFNGSRGAVVRVTFRAKQKGTASVTFNTANVYANDGLGTDVTTARKGISVSIGEQVTPVQTTPTPSSTPTNVPSAPSITSVDMPDPEKWYAKNQAVFSWNVGSSITSTQLLLGIFPSSVPTVIYTPPIGNKEITGLSDGVSYLHVRFANANGWGETAHRKIKVDTVPPTELSVASRITDDDYVELSLQAKDKTSGVYSYNVSFAGNLVGETNAVSGSSDTVTRLVIPALPPGQRELLVRAYDRAGNFTDKTITVEAPSLNVPQITAYSEVITKGDQLEVQGTTYPKGDVRVFIQPEDEKVQSYVVKANDVGVFVFKSDGIDHIGLTSVWTVATRGDMVQSDPSARVYTRVNKSVVVRAGLKAIEALSVIIPLSVLVLLFMFTTYYGFHKFRMMRRRLVRDLEKTEDESEKIFEVIKDDVKNSIQLFKRLSARRKVSDEEKEILQTLAKDVEQAEEYFAKRIEKIEKEDL